MIDATNNIEHSGKPSEPPARKTYERPRLINLGPVQALVLAGCSSGSDGPMSNNAGHS